MGILFTKPSFFGLPLVAVATFAQHASFAQNIAFADSHAIMHGRMSVQIISAAFLKTERTS